MKIAENVERFQYRHFETNFLKNENLFQILEYRFLNENTKIANAMFPYKVPSHKSMFRQIEWVEQITPITGNDVLPAVTSLFSWKFYFGLKAFYKNSV